MSGTLGNAGRTGAAALGRGARQTGRSRGAATQGTDDAIRPFRWRDGERLVCFGRGAVAGAQELLEAEGLLPYVLLTGSHGATASTTLAVAARLVVVVPPVPVPQAASAVAPILELGEERPAIVAIGGGRVIDAAKALAAALGLEVAAVPTSLSGAEMTAGHRPLADGRGVGPKRPRLVVNDAALSASQPPTALAASAMNALGHAMEALYGPGANPVTTAAAVRGAALIAAHLEAAAGGTVSEAAGGTVSEAAGHAITEERERLALGGLLSGYALGGTGAGLHHVLCQTIVRLTGGAHAHVNAVMLPHTLRFMLARQQEALAPLVRVLAPRGDDAAAVRVIEHLAALSGATRLEQLGVGGAELPAIAARALERPELRHLSAPPTIPELLALLEAASR
jgi:alcohol dehydrogenase class IV